MERAEVEIERAGRLRVGPPDDAEEILEYQKQREGQQQLEAFIAIVNAAQQPFDGRADGGCRQTSQ